MTRERQNYYKGRDHVPEHPRGPNKKHAYAFEQKITEQVVRTFRVRADTEAEARALISKAHPTVHAYSDPPKVLKRGELKLLRTSKGEKK